LLYECRREKLLRNKENSKLREADTTGGSVREPKRKETSHREESLGEGPWRPSEVPRENNKNHTTAETLLLRKEEKRTGHQGGTKERLVKKVLLF